MYINPPDISKETFLERYAQRVHVENVKSVLDKSPRTHIPVCLVDNGAFRAAGVCYSHQEFDAFNSPTDNRPKKWYVIEINNLTNSGLSFDEIDSLRNN